MTDNLIVRLLATYVFTLVCISFVVSGCSNKEDNYKTPSSFLGYYLGDSVEFSPQNADIIETISKPGEFHDLDGIKGGIFDLRCKDDFGGINFEKCRVLVSVNGIKLITAETTGVTSSAYHLAVKRMVKALGTPQTKKQDFTSWKIGEFVRLNFIIEGNTVKLIYGMF